eukprot:GGOE01055492.1.p2 GENE.GGOE01055492.1~~GGOE01055492.1.p2  ORF type:complete len:131 (+),score=14.95 GGOE01055492.1:38-394(+)
MPKYWATPAGKNGPPAPYLNDRTVIPAPNEWHLHHQPPMPKYWDMPPTPYLQPEQPELAYWPAPDPSVPARSATAIYGRSQRSAAPVAYGPRAAPPVAYGPPAALPVAYGAPPAFYYA